MSRRIDQPVASVKLTNVATVRLQIGGKRFEIACYKNKVLDYRAGLETDISEVLQTDQIFKNVSKGEFANKHDLKKAFPKLETQEDIALHILKNGKSLQISETERHALYENSLTQIATWIATNCLHPITGKPYTASQIKQALTTTTTTTNTTNTTNNHKSSSTSSSSSSFTVQPHKPIKQQYLQALKFLQQQSNMPIQRAAMELQWQFDETHQQEKDVLQALQKLGITASANRHPTTNNNNQQPAATTTDDDDGAVTNNTGITTCTSSRITFTIDPATYRPLQELVQHDFPNTQLIILRQQVFEPLLHQNSQQQQQSQTTVDDNEQSEAQPRDNNSSHQADSRSKDNNDDEQDEDGEEEDDSDDDDVAAAASIMTRKNQRKAKKKQQKKAAQRQRIIQQQTESSADDSSDEEDDDGGDNSDPKIATTTSSATTTLHVGSNKPKDHRTSKSSQESKGEEDASNTTTASAKFRCNTCVGSAFETQAQYRSHFKSDWHRFNQKLKLQNSPPISLQEFQQCDAESFFAQYK